MPARHSKGIHIRRTGKYLPLLLLLLLAVAAAGCRRASKPQGWAPPVAVSEGATKTLYASISNGKMASLDPDTLAVNWTFPPDNEVQCGAKPPKKENLEAIYGAPLVKDDSLYFGGYDGNIYALKRADGSCLWKFETKGPIVGGLALDGDTLYAGSDDGYLYVIDRLSGASKNGPFDTGDSIWSTPLIDDTDCKSTGSTPRPDCKRIYVPNVGGKMLALQTDTLHLAWSSPFQTGAGLITDPVLAGDVLLIGGIGQKLFGVDAKTGKQLWEAPLGAGNWFWGKPLVNGTTAYVPNLDHKVYAVDVKTGKPVWDQPFEASDVVRSSPVMLGGSLIVIDGNGNVYSLDPSTGKQKLPAPVVPFTIRQFESMKKMQAVQPELKELEKKYKDPRRRQEETMKIYKEMGINPLGCVMPMIIQMVVFIALYRALVFTVGGNPESLVGLSQRLYPVSVLKQSVPLNQHFLWLNLGQPDGTYVLPILVAYFTYVQQKLSQTPNATPQQLQQQQMMSWMLPLMLAWFTLALPSGVGVYWVVTNVFSLFASYYVYGRRAFSWRQVLLPLPGPGPAPAPAPGAKSEEARPKIANEPASNGEQPDGAAPRDKVRAAHGKRRGKRKNRR